jgi:hypothetical protein
MANLQNPGDIKYLSSAVATIEVEAHAKIWVVRLRSARDYLEVPILGATSNVAALTSPVTAAFYSATSTAALLEITGGSAGQDVVLATLHADWAGRKQT